jgi:hypothetical protein
MALMISTGSTAAGKYTRLYDPDVGDLLVMQGGTSPSASSQTITLPYETEDAAWLGTTTVIESTLSETAVIRSKTATSFLLQVRRSNGDALTTDPTNWGVYWIRSGSFSYDQLEIGSNASGQYAELKEAGVTLRVIQGDTNPGSTSVVTASLPLTLANLNYSIGTAGSNSTFADSVAGDGLNTVRTTSAITFTQERKNNALTGSFDWVADWILG